VGRQMRGLLFVSFILCCSFAAYAVSETPSPSASPFVCADSSVASIVNSRPRFLTQVTTDSAGISSPLELRICTAKSTSIASVGLLVLELEVSLDGTPLTESLQQLLCLCGPRCVPFWIHQSFVMYTESQAFHSRTCSRCLPGRPVVLDPGCTTLTALLALRRSDLAVMQCLSYRRQTMLTFVVAHWACSLVVYALLALIRGRVLLKVRCWSM
jgi:hypothetical protein